MNGTDVAVLAYLRDLGSDDGWIHAKVDAQDDPAAIAKHLGISASTARLSLRRLQSDGWLEIEESTGRRPGRYRTHRVLPADPPTQPADNPPTEPTEPTEPNPPIPAVPSRGRAEGPSSPQPPRPPTSATVAGPTEPTEPDDPTTRLPADPPSDVVEVGQAVVAWAVDEQRRLGKPPLDGALLSRIGSVALRMIKGGVSAVDLKLAAETLVQRDMTDLQAAHRKAQSGSGEIVSSRASGTDLDRLAVEAAASRAVRDRSHLGSLQREHAVEVWHFVAMMWGRSFRPAEQEFWLDYLQHLPIGGILWALDDLAKEGEHKRWPPTPGEVYRIAAPETIRRRHLRSLREDQRRAEEEA